MNLTQLPTEILEDFVSRLMPESFEDVALACKATWRASSRFVAEHNAMRKRFRHFRFDEVPEDISEDQTTPDDQDQQVFNFHENRAHGDACELPARGKTAITPQEKMERSKLPASGEIKLYNAIDLLEYIAEHPVAARYIEAADFSHDSLDMDAEDETPLIGKGRSALSSLVQSSSYLAEMGFDPAAWLDKMDSWLDGHADIFLLTLLPNARRLNLSLRFSNYLFDEECLGLLRLIVKRAKKYHESAGPPASLAKLEDLQARDEFDGHSAFSLHGVMELMKIPSVCEFAGASFVALDGFRHREEASGEPLSSNIKRVDLVCSVLGPNYAAKFLPRMKNLTALNLHWEVKYGESRFTDVGALLANIQAAVGSTLEELSVIGIGDLEEAGSTLWDMSGFKRLRTLHLDLEVLCGPKYNPEDEVLDDSTDIMRDDEAHPRLVDVLPSSIEQAAIYISSFGPDGYPEIDWLLAGMAEEHTVKLPKLRELKICVPRERSDMVYHGVSSDGPGPVPEGDKALHRSVEACGGIARVEVGGMAEFETRTFEMA